MQPKSAQTSLILLAKWVLGGLFCGAAIGVAVVFVVDGPSAFSSYRLSLTGLERSLLIPITIACAAVGALIGLVVGLLKITKRRLS